MSQSVIQQTFTEFLLCARQCARFWNEHDKESHFCFSGHIWILCFSLFISLSLSLVLPDSLCREPQTNSPYALMPLVPPCPYALWGLVSIKIWSSWVSILSSMKREFKDLTGWFYCPIKSSASTPGGHSCLIHCLLSKDERSILCEGNMRSSLKGIGGIGVGVDVCVNITQP